MRKFPDELRAALQQYATVTEYTQEEVVVTLLREALACDHSWQLCAIDAHRQA